MSAPRPSQTLAYIIVTTGVAYTALYLSYVVSSVDGAALTASTQIILFAKTSVELIAGWYGLAFLAGAIAFLRLRERTTTNQVAERARPTVGLVYLCCGDYG